MVPVHIVHHLPHDLQPTGASGIAYRYALSKRAMQMKALDLRPEPRPGGAIAGWTAAPGDTPSGAASGGGAILGGDGAPGSGTGIPGRIVNTGRF